MVLAIWQLGSAADRYLTTDNEEVFDTLGSSVVTRPTTGTDSLDFGRISNDEGVGSLTVIVNSRDLSSIYDGITLKRFHSRINMIILAP